MEPRTIPPSPVELNLLLNWPDRRTRPEWLAIFGASIALHLLVFTAGLGLPSLIGQGTPERQVVVHRIPLYIPRDIMTQREPNRTAVTKQIQLADLEASRAGSQAPGQHRAPSIKQFELPKKVNVNKQANSTVPPAPSIAMNQSQTAASPLGVPGGLPTAAPPPPQKQAGPFLNLGESTPAPNPHPTLAPPKASIDSAIQGLTQRGTSTHMAISDDVPEAPPGGAAIGQLPAQHSAVELESDPNGADFKIYLRTILGIVRTNWRRVIPESARMGALRGRTVVEFIISRDGSIPKLVTADSSGSEALDRAAVAGLSMSNPLPPLPADYKGLQVRLAFTFAYNMPTR